MCPLFESDSELWNAVRTDDQLAFKKLFDRYWIRLYNLSIRIINSPEICEEIVHDVFLNIWSRRKELDIIFLDRFLLRAVRYQVYNQMRSAKLPFCYIDDLAYNEIGGHENEGVSKMETQELEDEINKHLQKLPKRCREIFKMSRFKNQSNLEIANELGISKRSVENQLSAAVKYLKTCIAV